MAGAALAKSLLRTWVLHLEREGQTTTYPEIYHRLGNYYRSEK